MKKLWLFTFPVLALFLLFSCSDPNGNESTQNNSYSAKEESVTQTGEQENIPETSSEQDTSNASRDDSSNKNSASGSGTEQNETGENGGENNKNQPSPENQNSQTEKKESSDPSDPSLGKRFRKEEAKKQTDEKSRKNNKQFTRKDYVRLVSRMKSKPAHSFDLHTKRPNSLQFTPNGKQMISGGDDERLILWNMEKFEYTTTFFCGSPVTSVSASPNSKHFAGGTNRGVVHIWNQYYRRVNSYTRGAAAMTSLAYGPNGNFLAAGTDDGKIFIWNLNDNKLYATFKNHVKTITDLDFNTAGDHLVSSSKDGTVKEWNLHNKIMIRALNIDGWNSVTSVRYSPDEKYLVCGSVTGKIYVFQMKKLMDEKRDHFLLVGHKKPIASVRFHPRWNFLLSASRGKLMVIWSLDKEKPLKILEANNPITTATFGPGGNLIASGCENGDILLWSTGRKSNLNKQKGTEDPYHSMDIFRNFHRYNKEFKQLRMKLNEKFNGETSSSESSPSESSESEEDSTSSQSTPRSNNSEEESTEEEKKDDSNETDKSSSRSDSKKNAALKRIKTHPPLRPAGNKYKFKKVEQKQNKNGSSASSTEREDTAKTGSNSSNSPKTYPLVRVDPSGDGDYSSLKKAVSSVSRNTRIRIEPGVYKGEILLKTSGLILFSAPGNVIIKNPKGTGISIVGGKEIQIRGITVRDCKGHGIVVRNKGELQLENVVLQNNGETGILVSDTSSTARLELVDINGNAGNGLLIQNGGSAEVSNSTFSNHNSRFSPAVEVTGLESELTLESSVLRDNRTDAVLAREGSAPSINNCKIFGNQLAGIYLHSCRKRAEITNNKLFKNGGSSIIVEECTPPLIKGNKIYSHPEKVPAIFLNRSGGFIEQNTFKKNSDLSIFGQDPSSLQINNNTFTGYSEESVIPAIRLSGKFSRIVLMNNTFGRGPKKSIKGIRDYTKHKMRGNKFKWDDK